MRERLNTLAMREVGLSPCYRYQILMEIIQKENKKEDIYIALHIHFIEPLSFFVCLFLCCLTDSSTYSCKDFGVAQLLMS